MAMIFRGITTCALCGNVLRDGDEIVATSHFIGDETHPLWPYSDAGMHKGCFLAWESRPDFVRLFNETLAHVTFGNGTYHHMLDDGTVTNLRR
jgi:hypothetical protein